MELRHHFLFCLFFLCFCFIFFLFIHFERIALCALNLVLICEFNARSSTNCCALVDFLISCFSHLTGAQLARTTKTDGSDSQKHQTIEEMLAKLKEQSERMQLAPTDPLALVRGVASCFLAVLEKHEEHERGESEPFSRFW